MHESHSVHVMNETHCVRIGGRVDGQTAVYLHTVLYVLVVPCSFLGDEDDDISQSVFGFSHSYVAILKSVRSSEMEKTTLAH